jgi:NAD(P)-dependent dehydrogenase (short-subunit alcohol dehydrogenase family)
MTGKFCMITGANSGIGKPTALALAEMGATVVMVCRNRDTGEEALREIRQRTGNRSSELLTADLSSQAAIRNLAAEFTEKHDRLTSWSTTPVWLCASGCSPWTALKRPLRSITSPTSC